MEPVYLGWPHANEIALTRQAWNLKYAGHLVFSARLDNAYVGLMAVSPFRANTTAGTALWNMAYVRHDLRGVMIDGASIATRLYAARETFTREFFSRAIFPVHTLNAHSRNIHVAHGAVAVRTERLSWHHQNPAMWTWYRRDFPRSSPAIVFDPDAVVVRPATRGITATTAASPS